MFIFKLRHDKRGMTLIEMIISLVILSILMTSTMGMITSSMSIFTATSMAALDRMVGNSVYQTLESSLKYATHLTIRDTADSSLTAQSFYISVSDTDSNSGNLMYRRDGDEYINLYSSDFYGGRTIQYCVEEVGSDNRHVEITVNVFRESEIVYTKTAVIKCINLALIKSASNDNTINNDEVTPDTVNQYLYFAVDEMLIAGGSEAWSLEYKLNDYMNQYNAILAEYYGKLCLSDNPLDDALEGNANESGKRIVLETLNTLLTLRDKAIFGVGGGGEVAWEGDDYTKYCNLRQHYQEEILDLLKFAPDNAGYNNSNPYYHVVATKEELYTGFMLTYYDDNKDGVISREEFPAFEDQNTFFAGTVLSTYATESNGMVILTFFNDYLNDDYSSLFKSYDDVVYYYESLELGPSPTQNIRIASSASYFGGTIAGDGYYYYDYSGIGSTLGTVLYTFRRDAGGASTRYRYTYSEDGTTVVEDNNTRTYPKLGIYNEEKSNLFGTNGDTDDEIWESVAPRMNFVVNGSEVSSPVLKKLNTYQTDTIEWDGTYGNKIVITAGVDLPEGWYWYHESGTNDSGRTVFFLEAATNAPLNGDGQRIAVAKGGTIALYSHNWKVLYMYYDQLQYDLNDGVNNSNKNITRYDFQKHEYKDWIAYGVDWNSWFKTSQEGLLNSVIGTVASWFTGKSDITSISGDNAENALGLMGQYNIDGVDSKIQSFNSAWIVYNTRRSTWYYLPDTSNRITTGLSNITWYSNKNTPVPLDTEAWGSSTKMISDIEARKLSSTGLFGLIDTTEDRLWVPLPTGGKIDRT